VDPSRLSQHEIKATSGSRSRVNLASPENRSDSTVAVPDSGIVRHGAVRARIVAGSDAPMVSDRLVPPAFQGRMPDR
jgi:hypothetical protein